MSQEDLQKFLEAVREDSSLQEKLQAAGADPIAVAEEAGFSVTRAELLRSQADRVQSLSDEELEAAAGGTVFGRGSYATMCLHHFCPPHYPLVTAQCE
jgi:predicted ribosomally synthesized peptide with nif11-like leader